MMTRAYLTKTMKSDSYMTVDLGGDEITPEEFEQMTQSEQIEHIRRWWDDYRD